MLLGQIFFVAKCFESVKVSRFLTKSTLVGYSQRIAGCPE